MVKSEETCLFRSNCFVRMTSADHEVTTGKSAPWGGWNEISYQPTCSSSLLHFVPFVICKAKEMFCSPWFFFHRFFPREKKKTMHLTGFSKVSAPASGLFGPSFRGEWLGKRNSPLFLPHPRPYLTHLQRAWKPKDTLLGPLPWEEDLHNCG